MINVKKGPAHSLGQSDVRGPFTDTSIVAGMVCHINSTGVVTKGIPASGATGVVGFAINDAADGDAIESGKIALYTLDGASVIETDQVKGDVTAANFAIGRPVFATDTAGTAADIGLVLCTANNATNVQYVASTPLGWVEGIRFLQADGNKVMATGQGYTSINRETGAITTTGTKTYSGQKNIPVLSIKLAAGNPVGNA